MDKIVIDTNILYSWVGINVNPKFPPDKIDEFARTHELYCTTPSIIEFLVKFKHDTKMIKMCLEPFIEKKLLIVAIGFIPIPSETMIKIYHSDSQQFISSQIDGLLNLKIEKEAEMLRFFLFCILGGMFNIFRDIGSYNFGDKERDSLFIYSSNILLLSNSDDTIQAFVEALRIGYSSNTESQMVRKEFSARILSMLNVWVMNYYFVKHGLLLDSFKNPDPKKLANLHQDLDNDKMVGIFRKYVDNPFAILSKKGFRIPSDKFISTLKGYLENHPHITEEVLSHILSKLQKTFATGAKVNKNDIMDLFILYTLNLKELKFRIITLDGALAESIKAIHPASYALMKSLGLL